MFMLNYSRDRWLRTPSPKSIGAALFNKACSNSEEDQAATRESVVSQEAAIHFPPTCVPFSGTDLPMSKNRGRQKQIDRSQSRETSKEASVCQR
jgi:hypothetical protein